MHSDSASEEAYLRELIRDFGADGCPAPGEAMQRIKAAFQQRMTAAETADPAHTRSLRPEDYVALSRSVHEHLFDGILANAGSFRLASDLGGGHVEYGGPHRRRAYEPQFYGFSPGQIEPGLLDAFTILIEEPDPVRASIRMYQRFVRVHPFYDANGRVGRVLVTLFLVSHGLYPDWDRLDRRKGKFLQKLNAVHEHAGREHTEQTYTDYLVRFWATYVQRLDEFFGMGEDLPPAEASGLVLRGARRSRPTPRSGGHTGGLEL